VVQTAAKLVIEPIFEADFDEAAYGYRPRRSAHDAIRIIHKALDDARTEVVDADLRQYFDTIPPASNQQDVGGVKRFVSQRAVLCNSSRSRALLTSKGSILTTSLYALR
jgi:RNA-directed DNA polymerase